MRGHKVPFDPQTINNLFHQPNIDRDDYVNYLHGQVNHSQGVEALYGQGIDWV